MSRKGDRGDRNQIHTREEQIEPKRVREREERGRAEEERCGGVPSPGLLTRKVNTAFDVPLGVGAVSIGRDMPSSRPGPVRLRSQREFGRRALGHTFLFLQTRHPGAGTGAAASTDASAGNEKLFAAILPFDEILVLIRCRWFRTESAILDFGVINTSFGYRRVVTVMDVDFEISICGTTNGNEPARSLTLGVILFFTFVCLVLSIPYLLARKVMFVFLQVVICLFFCESRQILTS